MSTDILNLTAARVFLLAIRYVSLEQSSSRDRYCMYCVYTQEPEVQSLYHLLALLNVKAKSSQYHSTVVMTFMSTTT